MAVVYVLWMQLLKHNDVSTIAVYKFGVPVAGVLLSGVLLGENVFTIRSLTAMVSVALGIILVNLQTKSLTPVLRRSSRLS